MVKVVVGENRGTRDFVIHEALLTSRSRFFKKAMAGDWKEAEEKLVKLPEDDPAIFALYEQLVYTGRIPAFDGQPEPIEEEKSDGDFDDDDSNYDDDNDGDDDNDSDGDGDNDEYESLAELYVLAEKLQDLGAKNTTVKAIIAKITHEGAIINDCGEGPCLPGAVAIKTMYEKTPGHCAGRQIFLDSFVYYAQDYPIFRMDQADILPREFLCEMVDNALTYRAPKTELMPHKLVKRYMEVEGMEFDCNMDAWYRMKRYRKNARIWPLN
jgi:hypothetical protein